MDKIRILIADDHPVFRFGLRALLETTPGMDVVGEAATGDDAVALAADLQPEVVLMDVNMPGVNGLDATRRILQTSPHIGVLIITMFDDDSVFAAMQAGARGYLLKGAEPAETVSAVRAVAGGEAIFSPAVAKRVMDFFAQRPPAEVPQLFPELTNREREVLSLIAQGFTNTAIAEHLTLSVKTVRNLVSNIFDKLQVVDRAEAIIRARDAGLGRGA
ncbi:MAG: response regulator transcription factor [Chloroflexia bacterium]